MSLARQQTINRLSTDRNRARRAYVESMGASGGIVEARKLALQEANQRLKDFLKRKGNK